ncbi:MAG: ACP S-malonyltransferase [Myxococcota bacterium]
MGKVAFVFPGQGSQKVGMGREAHDAWEVARDTFRAADAALDESLSKLCFEGPEAELKLTRNTQPAILAVSVALWRALDMPCDVVAGHSLGEYSAHVAAGTLPFDDAVRIVRARGEYMQQAVPVGEGAMAAVMGAERELVERICADVDGDVEPANYNAPGQIVVAGTAAAVNAAGAALKEAGARVVPLPVSAPFHSRLMRPAEERLRSHLREAPFAAPRVPVYVNVDAEPVTAAEAAADALERQVSRPVRWEESVQRMVADGVTLFVEIGPGRVLAGLIGRIAKGAKRVNVRGPDDLEAAREAIGAERA